MEHYAVVNGTLRWLANYQLDDVDFLWLLRRFLFLYFTIFGFLILGVDCTVEIGEHNRRVLDTGIDQNFKQNFLNLFIETFSSFHNNCISDIDYAGFEYVVCNNILGCAC